MEDITYEITDPQGDDKQVDVVFNYAGVTHERKVNAVFTGSVYDKEATAQRVQEVSLGVVNKINAGAIKNKPQEEVHDEDQD